MKSAGVEWKIDIDNAAHDSLGQRDDLMERNDTISRTQERSLRGKNYFQWNRKTMWMKRLQEREKILSVFSTHPNATLFFLPPEQQCSITLSLKTCQTKVRLARWSSSATPHQTAIAKTIGKWKIFSHCCCWRITPKKESSIYMCVVHRSTLDLLSNCYFFR